MGGDILDDIKLSKTIAYALRHNPLEFNLVLDSDGFADVFILINSLKKDSRFKDVSLDDIKRVVINDSKGRYLLLDNKIKAFSGHSVKENINQVEIIPPSILYHGTSPLSVFSIMNKGLLPMERQYVHLSSDIDTAYSVGLRKHDNPVILVIDTIKAREFGVKFYVTNNNSYLASSIPSLFIKELEK